MKTILRIVTIFAVLGVALFAAIPAAQAGGWTCWMPQQTYWESYILSPDEDGTAWNMICNLPGAAGTGLADDATGSAPASINMYNGFVSATIEGIPGVSFKAFMYVHHPLVSAPLPDGWNRYGYGVDIFYDNASVNPSGYVCFGLPEGVVENLEVGVFSYKDGEYTRLSKNGCGYFQGGGTFFMLMQNVETIGLFTPPF